VGTIQNEADAAGMTWLPLDSKMLASVTYDQDCQILYLRFRKTGDVYRYSGFRLRSIGPSSTLSRAAASFLPKSEIATATNASQNSALLSSSRRPSPDAYQETTQHCRDHSRQAPR
jgi:hypothetical protein